MRPLLEASLLSIAAVGTAILLLAALGALIIGDVFYGVALGGGAIFGLLYLFEVRVEVKGRK